MRTPEQLREVPELTAEAHQTELWTVGEADDQEILWGATLESFYRFSFGYKARGGLVNHEYLSYVKKLQGLFGFQVEYKLAQDAAKTLERTLGNLALNNKGASEVFAQGISEKTTEIDEIIHKMEQPYLQIYNSDTYKLDEKRRIDTIGIPIVDKNDSRQVWSYRGIRIARLLGCISYDEGDNAFVFSVQGKNSREFRHKSRYLDEVGLDPQKLWLTFPNYDHLKKVKSQ